MAKGKPAQTTCNNMTIVKQIMIDEILEVSADDFGAFARDHLDQGITIRFRAHGRSMQPAVCNGDIITVAPIDKQNLKTGNIILHRAGKMNQLVAHRIIRITGSGNTKTFHTRGDAFGCHSEALDESDILGITTHLEHNGIEISINTLPPHLKSRIWILWLSVKIRLKKILQRLQFV
jgi:signal peptidase I